MNLSEKFTANGKNYSITTQLSVQRFIEFEIAQVELGFGVSFNDMVKQFQKIYDAANKGKLADVSIFAYNALNGIKTRLEDRTHPVIKICSLFINYEGEDTSVWSDEVAKQKQEDWIKAGIPMDDFFSVALNSVENLLTVYGEISRSTSEFLKMTEAKTSSETND